MPSGEEVDEAKEDSKDKEKFVDEQSLNFDKKGFVIADVLKLLKERDKEKYPDRTHVLVNVCVGAIDKVSTLDQTFYADIQLQYFWQDDNLIGMKDEDFDHTKIWTPDVDFINGIDVQSTDDVSQTFYISKALNPLGIISNFRRFKGTFSSRFDLRTFPFDTQTLAFELMSNSYCNSDLVFVNFTMPQTVREMSQMVKLDEWSRLGDFDISVYDNFALSDGRDYSTFRCEIQLRRKPGFYLQKVVALVMIIGMMLCGAFIVPPVSISDRIQITITLFLSAVAFNYVVVTYVPKISYSTHIDKFFNMNYALLGTSALEHIASFYIEQFSGFNSARILDYISIVVFFFLYLGYISYFFFLGWRTIKKSVSKFTTKKTATTDEVEEKLKIYQSYSTRILPSAEEDGHVAIEVRADDGQKKDE